MAAEQRTMPKKSKAVEFISELAYITEHIESGFRPRAIWQCLHEEGRITMTYQMFLNYIKRQFPSRLPLMPQAPQTRRQGAAAKPDIKPPVRTEPPKPRTVAKPSPEINGDGVRTHAGFRMDPNRPLRPNIEMPEPFKHNPIPMTKEEILKGRRNKDGET